MAEEVVNIKVLIDSTKSSKSISELENNVEELNKELGRTEKGSDSFKALSKAVDDSDKQMKELALSTDKTTATIGELEKSIEVLTTELKGVERGSEEFNKLSKELIKANGELKNIELSLEALDTEQVASELGSVTGAVGDVTSAFILLGGEGNRTIEEIGRNLEIAIGLSTGVKGAIEGIQSGIKLWNKYGDAIKQSTVVTKIATISQKAFNVVQKAFALATGTGTKALKILKVALISTGIGAIIVGIGVAVGLIISNWESLKKSFTSGAIGKALKVLFFPITLAIASIKALYSLFTTGSASTLKNLEKERKAREENAEMLIEEAKLHVENSKEIQKEAEELRKTAEVFRVAGAERLAGLEQQLRVQQALNGNTAETRALELDLAQQREIEAKENLKNLRQAAAKQKEALNEANIGFEKTVKARIGFLNTSEAVQKKTAKAEKDALKNLTVQASAYVKLTKELRVATDEQGKATDDLEVTEASQSKGRSERAKERKRQGEQDAKDEIKRLEDIQSIEEDLFQRGLESESDRQARRLTLQFEANRKRIEKLVKDDEKLKILLKQNEAQFFKDLETIEDNFEKLDDKKRQDLINKSIQTARDIALIEQEINLEKLSDQEKNGQKGLDILKKIESLKIERIRENAEIQLQNEELTAEERIKIEKEALLEIERLNNEARKTEREADNEANEQRKEDKKALSEALVSLSFEVAQQIADASFEIAQANAEKESEGRLKALDDSFNAELDRLNQKVDDGLISQAEADRKAKEQERKKNAGILSEQKKLFQETQKRQRAQAIINGALAFTNALATTQPLVPLGLVAGAGVLISTGIQIAKIDSQKFARGGILNGASHSGGGIKTSFGELEGGEAVINKSSTSMFKDTLSNINQAGGGIKFASGGILGNQQASSTSQTPSDLGGVLSSLNERLSQPIRSFVVETDVTETQLRVEKLERNSDL